MAGLSKQIIFFAIIPDYLDVPFFTLFKNHPNGLASTKAKNLLLSKSSLEYAYEISKSGELCVCISAFPWSLKHIYQVPQVHLKRAGMGRCDFPDLANNDKFFFATSDVGFSKLSQGVIPWT